MKDKIRYAGNESDSEHDDPDPNDVPFIFASELRKLSMEELGQFLVDEGFNVDIVHDMCMWNRIDIIKQLVNHRIRLGMEQYIQYAREIKQRN